jgi:glutamate/tyrosine decarboxylase-like PLP-dependent enzyme
MLAELRRNFPFYSPRYLAHQLSDTTIPSMLGYFAGMLFNPNNVTPGAAPVTTEMEILACNAILEMLGFTPPPPPPKREVVSGKSESTPTSDFPLPTSNEDYYRTAGQHEYGWAHLASGGTVANIEALWAARQVRYSPLSIKSVAKDLGLSLPVTLANRTRIDIQRASDRDLLLLPIREAIELLPRYIAALKTRDGYETLQGPELGRAAWKLLSDSPQGLSRGCSLFHHHPPVLLVAGTRHYSITKAADILGIGAANVIHVATDENFRMDAGDLRSKLEQALYQGRIPLAVIASMGTTEEGSIDPIDKILEVRRDLESHHNASFWLHADAAWGGYIRCLFRESADSDPQSKTQNPKSKIESTRTFVSETIDETPLSWPSDPVGHSLLSLSSADSITVDPHKLGYAPYPSGCIAFRNDRVRTFLQQRCPYISATTPDPLIPVPPRHARLDPLSHSRTLAPSHSSDVVIDSFSPFILEGSRPGAAATSLWLSIQTTPLTREGHGRIIRESLLAAQWLYECLRSFDGQDLELIPLTPGPPDTSIVTFTIKRRSSPSLAAMNALTQAVHDRFSIQSELGERRYSYSQPFFLSSTHMEKAEYPTLTPFFARCNLHHADTDYPTHGLTVLRAAVMSPYLGASRRLNNQDFAKLFVQDITQAAHEILAAGGARVPEHHDHHAWHAKPVIRGGFPVHPRRHGEDNCG